MSWSVCLPQIHRCTQIVRLRRVPTEHAEFTELSNIHAICGRTYQQEILCVLRILWEYISARDSVRVSHRLHGCTQIVRLRRVPTEHAEFTEISNICAHPCNLWEYISARDSVGVSHRLHGCTQIVRLRRVPTEHTEFTEISNICAHPCNLWENISARDSVCSASSVGNSKTNLRLSINTTTYERHKQQE
mgnify:CR=1 FL=1